MPPLIGTVCANITTPIIYILSYMPYLPHSSILLKTASLSKDVMLMLAINLSTLVFVCSDIALKYVIVCMYV